MNSKTSTIGLENPRSLYLFELHPQVIGLIAAVYSQAVAGVPIRGWGFEVANRPIPIGSDKWSAGAIRHPTHGRCIQLNRIVNAYSSTPIAQSWFIPLELEILSTLRVSLPVYPDISYSEDCSADIRLPMPKMQDDIDELSPIFLSEDQMRGVQTAYEAAIHSDDDPSDSDLPSSGDGFEPLPGMAEQREDPIPAEVG